MQHVKKMKRSHGFMVFHVMKMKLSHVQFEKSRKSCSIERISKLSHGFMVFPCYEDEAFTGSSTQVFCR
jgi:hypothetical protein